MLVVSTMRSVEIVLNTFRRVCHNHGYLKLRTWLSNWTPCQNRLLCLSQQVQASELLQFIWSIFRVSNSSKVLRTITSQKTNKNWKRLFKRLSFSKRTIIDFWYDTRRYQLNYNTIIFFDGSKSQPKSPKKQRWQQIFNVFKE